MEVKKTKQTVEYHFEWRTECKNCDHTTLVKFPGVKVTKMFPKQTGKIKTGDL